MLKIADSAQDDQRIGGRRCSQNIPFGAPPLLMQNALGGPAVCASGLRKGAVCKTVGLNAGDMRKVDFTRSRIRPYIDQARRLQRRWQALARLINSASCQY